MDRWIRQLVEALEAAEQQRHKNNVVVRHDGKSLKLFHKCPSLPCAMYHVSSAMCHGRWAECLVPPRHEPLNTPHASMKASRWVCPSLCMCMSIRMSIRMSAWQAHHLIAWTTLHAAGRRTGAQAFTCARMHARAHVCMHT